MPTHSNNYKPDMPLYAVGIMVLMYVWRVQDLIPGLASLRLGIVSALITLSVLLVAKHPYRKFAMVNSRTAKLLGVLYVLMLFSVPSSLWPGKSLSFLIVDYSLTLLMAFSIAAAVRSARDLEWLAMVSVIGAACYSLFVMTKYQVDSSGRLGGLIYYDANDFALLLVCTLPFAVFFMRENAPVLSRVFGCVALAIFVAMLVKSGSRGGFLGFIAVMLYLLFRYKPLKAKSRAAIAATGVALLILFATPAYWGMMRTLLKPQEDYNWVGGEEAGRMELWKRGAGYMVSRPLFGVGIRAFPQAEGTLSEQGKRRAARGRGFKWSVAHNSFVELGAESGIPALTVFLVLLYGAWSIMGKIKSAKLEQALGMTLKVSLLGFVVAGFFVSAWYFAYLYMLLGFAMGLEKILHLKRAHGANNHYTYPQHARA